MKKNLDAGKWEIEYKEVR